MNNLKKIDDILGVTVKIDTAIVTLAGIWKEIGPDVKKALKEILETAVKTLGTITLHLLNIVLDGTGIKLDEDSDILQIIAGALAGLGIVVGKGSGIGKGGALAMGALALSIGSDASGEINLREVCPCLRYPMSSNRPTAVSAATTSTPAC